MSDVLAWGGILLALGATIWGKMLLTLAAGYVKDAHPGAFETIAGRRTLFGGLSRPEHRVRRALAAGLLWGGLPEPLGSDPKMGMLATRWRGAVGAIAGGFAMVGMSVAV